MEVLQRPRMGAGAACDEVVDQVGHLEPVGPLVVHQRCELAEQVGHRRQLWAVATAVGVEDTQKPELDTAVLDRNHEAAHGVAVGMRLDADRFRGPANSVLGEPLAHPGCRVAHQEGVAAHLVNEVLGVRAEPERVQVDVGQRDRE